MRFRRPRWTRVVAGLPDENTNLMVIAGSRVKGPAKLIAGSFVLTKTGQIIDYVTAWHYNIKHKRQLWELDSHLPYKVPPVDLPAAEPIQRQFDYVSPRRASAQHTMCMFYKAARAQGILLVADYPMTCPLHKQVTHLNFVILNREKTHVIAVVSVRAGAKSLVRQERMGIRHYEHFNVPVYVVRGHLEIPRNVALIVKLDNAVPPPDQEKAPAEFIDSFNDPAARR